jgi:hypothetical protein
MSNYQRFVSRYIDKTYETINASFELDPILENALRASIAVDLLIYYIETINRLSLEKSRIESSVDQLSDASLSLFSESIHFKAIDFASSREEAAAVLTDLTMSGMPGDIEEIANANIGLNTLTKSLYNCRVKKYFAEDQTPVMVISSAVPMLVKNIGLEETDFEFIQEVNSIFMVASTNLVDVIMGKSFRSPEPEPNNNCYIVTAASGSADTQIVEFYRDFRDEFLNKSKSGRWFIKKYYKHSPRIAKVIARISLLQILSLGLLVLLSRLLRLFKSRINK